VAVGGRQTTPVVRLLGPVIKLGLGLLGHPHDWHYWTVHEPWAHLRVLARGDVVVEPFLGFEYTVWATKGR